MWLLSTFRSGVRLQANASQHGWSCSLWPRLCLAKAELPPYPSNSIAWLQAIMHHAGEANTWSAIHIGGHGLCCLIAEARRGVRRCSAGLWMLQKIVAQNAVCAAATAAAAASASAAFLLPLLLLLCCCAALLLCCSAAAADAAFLSAAVFCCCCRCFAAVPPTSSAFASHFFTSSSSKPT